MSVVILTTGVPGCGKTYVRCVRFLVDDFLVNSNGVHISNFPINSDEISFYVAKKINRHRGFFGIFRKKVTPEDIRQRLEVIPDLELQRWRAGVSGPWSYFQGRDLKYCHIAIDEIHNFLNSRTPPDVVKQWDDFLGEVRHRGCTFEGLTQDIGQVSDVLTGRASLRLELVPAEDLRDPFFKIRMMDWYELKAGFLGSLHKTVFMYEKRKSGSYWKTNHVSRFFIIPDYFRFYNSFNASLQEKAAGSSDDDRTPQYEFQRRGKISLLFWFLRRNWFTIFWRLGLAAFFFWLCFMGGLNFFISRWLSASNASFRSNSRNRSAVVSRSDQSSSSLGPVRRSAALSKESQGSQGSQGKLDVIKYEDSKKREFENGYKPGLFFDGSCWLRNGIKIHPGYKFSDEKRDQDFFGKTVTLISEKDRYYLLDDGSILVMY